jgi:integrase
MATFETRNISALLPKRDPETNKIIDWVSDGSDPRQGVPHIYFNDGEPWLEANRYAIDKLLNTSGNNPKTVTSALGHLKNYADWIEDNDANWRHFPKRKKDRVLVRYRGFLVSERNTNQIMPSTASARMSAVIRFYRWCYSQGLMGDQPLWVDSAKVVRFFSTEGFNRTMTIISSELSIPNRKRNGLTLEGGLLPISSKRRDTLLNYLADNNYIELRLMLVIGFFTGARSETIRTLMISNIEKALEDPQVNTIKYVKVGPPTNVKTKFDVSGEIPFPINIIKEIESYIYSPRRLKRQARSNEKNRTCVFLTTRGNPYNETTLTKLMSDIRKGLSKKGLDQFKNFKFHQTRATFGSTLMSLALDYLPDKADAICFVRDAMLHKHEAITWGYVKFIERQPLKEKYAAEFYSLITGQVSANQREQALEDYHNG